MENIQKKIIDLNNKLEILIIEGLRRKGFIFSTEEETYFFIKNNCSRVDNIKLKEHIYYVKHIPFFLHKYKIICEPIIEDCNEIKYAFL